MSGGHLTDYGSSSLYDVLNWAKMIERDNPLFAEQLRDIHHLLDRYDYYLSGDIGKDSIQKAWEQYRTKWINIDTEEVMKIMFEKCLDMVDSVIKGYAKHED